MTDVEMFRVVYNELIDCPLFIGCYDAKNGHESYMHGVATVMEYIANRAGYLDEFEKLFDYNMAKSQGKVNKELEVMTYRT